MYLSQKYVEKYSEEVFKTKTELAIEILEERLQANETKIPNKRILLLVDAFYSVKQVLDFSREKGITYVGRLKKCRQIRLFSNWIRVEDYFTKYKKERYFTCEGVKVFYKEAILEVKKLGRVKVFGFREENSSEYKYYVTNRLNMCAKTCHRNRKIRWAIEDMHRDEKQFCGLENTCAWKKDSLLAHYSFVFFLWWLFERFRREQGLNISFEALWWEYCVGVDWTKAERIQLGKHPPIAALLSYV